MILLCQPSGSPHGKAEVSMMTQPSYVLVVDDDEINRLVATEVLGQMGLRVEQASSGVAAIEAVLARPPALVLMDVQMPVVDGLEATRRIRAAGFTELPILAFTAPATPEDYKRIDACGMSGLLAKPIEPERLKSTVQHWLSAIESTPGHIALSAALHEMLRLSGEVDPDDALLRSDGDPDLLVERLRGLVDICAETTDSISEALTDGNMREASTLFLSLRLPCTDVAALALAREAHSIGLCLLRADPPVKRAEMFLMRFEGFLAQLSEAVYG